MSHVDLELLEKSSLGYGYGVIRIGCLRAKDTTTHSNPSNKKKGKPPVTDYPHRGISEHQQRSSTMLKARNNISLQDDTNKSIRINASHQCCDPLQPRPFPRWPYASALASSPPQLAAQELRLGTPVSLPNFLPF